MKRKATTIQRVVKRGLCTGCGACVGLCPNDALTLRLDPKKGCFVPELHRDQCTRCGLCYAICPGHRVDFDGLSDTLFGDIPENVAMGRYLGCYIGHALDGAIRHDSASGGLVTALLVFALEEGLIEGALVTRMRDDKPLEPESFIARTRDEILAAAGSKYCPVAADVALKEILGAKGQFAVVGLPCHLQALRKAEQRLPELSARIRYRIGIACSLNYSFLGTDRFLRSLDLDPETVEILEYRGRGWPGSMRIRMKDGTETVVPLDRYYRKLSPYSLRRCLLCSDMFGELSDLSCGDAWVPKAMKTDTIGSSFVLSRTAEADELLEIAAANEAIELSELSVPELLAGQGYALFKKRKLKARMRLFRLTGRAVPAYRQKLMKPIRSDYSNMVKFLFARGVLSGQSRILCKLFHVARFLARKIRKKPSSTRPDLDPVKAVDASTPDPIE